MRTDVKKTKVFPYAELSAEAQEKAVRLLADINIDFAWWENVYEDAATVHLKLTGFDIDRGSYCKGEFINAAEDTADVILKNHGDSCETYQTATNYLLERGGLVEKHSDGENINTVAEDNEYEFDNDCDELDAEFLKSILEDYRIMLQKEFEYLTSEKAIVETIEANEYEFTEDGRIYS